MLFLIFVVAYLLIGGLIVEGHEWLVQKAFDSGVITEDMYDEMSIIFTRYNRLGIFKLLVWAMWPYIITGNLIRIIRILKAAKDDIGTD